MLQKVPPFVIWTSEFDTFKRDNYKMMERGKKLGKLLEFSTMPGVGHGYQTTNISNETSTWFYEEERLAFDTWVRGKK